jgi:hypothetical protein
MMLWKIFYDDGSTFADCDGLPEDAPGRCVLAVVQEDKRHGWQILAQKTYFVWDDRGHGFKWWETDRDGLSDYLFNYTGKKIALMGRFVEDEEFERIHRAAMNDDYFPKKPAAASWERKP